MTYYPLTDDKINQISRTFDCGKFDDINMS